MSAEILNADSGSLFHLGAALIRQRIRARSLGIGDGGLEGGVLLLDEVSSNVDHETERLMQDNYQS
jgi:hypothetical protein